MGRIKNTMNQIYIQTRYVHYYQKKVKKNYILIETKKDVNLAGNMFHILKELQKPVYKGYKIFVVCKKNEEAEITKMLHMYKINHYQLVEFMSMRYYKYISISKYLFTDGAFLRRYVKKQDQVIVNTWNGTPMNKVGQDVPDRVFEMGNAKRNLLFSDYLVMPNDYMIDVMSKAFGLNELFNGKILCEGYPQNTVFFDEKAGASIRKELTLEGKEVFIYMPIWRGPVTDRTIEYATDILEYYLYPLDKLLKDNQVLYVKQNENVLKAIDFSRFSHIKKYESQYDVYEFLNICDVLITDYSSIVYDFANTKKKIILFAYDETRYMRGRGLYRNLRDYPFPVVKKVEDLAKELNLPKQYDDTQFLNECCTYDGPGAAERICRHTILNEKVCKELVLERSHKENVLIYSAGLAKNGVTTSMLNLFQCIDISKRNYLITFKQDSLAKFPERIRIIPDGIGILPTSNNLNQTLLETLAFELYFTYNKDSRLIQKYLDRLFQREVRKYFACVRIDTAIQFAGYDKMVTHLFKRLDCRRVIYVHNDMVKELKHRGNQHYLTIHAAYNQYDKVVVVTEDIMAPTIEIAGKMGTNKVIVNNCLAYKDIIERAKSKVEFDGDTYANIDRKKLQDILDSDAKKVITVGRFSHEKGHMMLMKAFEKFSKKHPNHYLIIIGGHGNLFQETQQYANDSNANIIIIRSLLNPMPILAKCDLFILSSYYEGLGLTLLEADVLGIPTISTNIPGPRGFVKEHNGVLVEPNEESIYRGMLDYMDGKIQAMNVDYEAYNANAVKQFESLFDNKNNINAQGEH